MKKTRTPIVWIKTPEGDVKASVTLPNGLIVSAIGRGAAYEKTLLRLVRLINGAGYAVIIIQRFLVCDTIDIYEVD